MDYLEMIQKIEEEVVNGNNHKTHNLFKKLNYKKVPFRYRSKLANLAWRSGHEWVGLKILHPVVCSEEAKALGTIPDREVIEYSVILHRIGSNEEAKERLQKVDPDTHPKVLLYQAFCNFAEWKYEESIPILRKYLKNDLDTYEKFVGKVNYLAALTTSGMVEEAIELYHEVYRKVEAGSFIRLKANILELGAQLYISRRQWNKAIENLNSATGALKSDSSFDRLSIDKWYSICQSLRSKNIEAIQLSQKNAARHNAWEIVRDLNLYSLKVNFDPYLFNKLLFGTPYSSFQERACKILERPAPLRKSTILRGQNPVIDFRRARLGNNTILSQGKNLHKVLYWLSADLYKPSSIGTLFSRIFFDERFDVYFSTNKIHQLVSRTREALEENKVSLSITEKNGMYSLVNPENLSYQLDFYKKFPVKEELWLERLGDQTEFSKGPFTRLNVMEFLNIPLTTTQRFIRWSIKEKKISKIGHGVKTRYVLCASLINKSKAS